MVITSSTQWTIPLSSSSLSSPPATTCSSRQTSMLGLKTCHHHAHALHSSSEPHRRSHHQDLHSISSRRLQGAESVISRRSAGSFRQLVQDDFFAKLGHEGLPFPASHEMGELQCSYDGIAMPWRSSPLHALDVATASRAGLRGNLIDVDGDITADDVDLLPIPGLLSCSSPFIAGPGYISHTQSSKDLFSPESSCCSKSGVTVPNYLGLPPEFDMGLAAEGRAAECEGLVDNGNHASAPPTPSIAIEPARCGGNHLSCVGHAQSGKGVDDFADSLSGLWSIPAGIDGILQDSQSLPSMFNAYAQNFHGYSSAEQNGFDVSNTGSVPCIMDGLQCLMDLSREETGKLIDVLHASSPAHNTFSVHDPNDSMLLEADNDASLVTSDPCASDFKSSVKVSASDVLAASNASGLSHARAYMEFPMQFKNYSESTNLKRPFNVLDLASLASSAASAGSYVSRSTGWLSSSNSMVRNGHEESNCFSPFLYDSQNDCNLGINLQHHMGINLQHHYMAKNGGNSDEEMLPKPPPAKIRKKHGTAMDPQSIAARTRRERFSDRIRILQSLVPNGERLDTVAMLSQTLEYVKFLQHQVWHLYHGKDPASFDNCEKWKDFVEAAPASAN